MTFFNNFFLSQCLIGDRNIVMNSIMKVSAMNRKYIASSENNSYENNNKEIITFYSTIIPLDNIVNNSDLIQQASKLTML